MSEEDSNEVNVSEDKFNGTATYVVTHAENKREARAAAKGFWRDEYDTSPSKVVAEADERGFGDNRYYVMVADHSSGSLKSSKSFEF